MPPINESLGVPINESLGYNSNNIDNTINDNENTPNNNVVGELFPEEQKVEEPKEKKTLFRNSDVYKMVKFETALAWIIQSLKVSLRHRNLKRSIWFITFIRLAIGATKRI